MRGGPARPCTQCRLKSTDQGVYSLGMSYRRVVPIYFHSPRRMILWWQFLDYVWDKTKRQDFLIFNRLFPQLHWTGWNLLQLVFLHGLPERILLPGVQSFAWSLCEWDVPGQNGTKFMPTLSRRWEKRLRASCVVVVACSAVQPMMWGHCCAIDAERFSFLAPPALTSLSNNCLQMFLLPLVAYFCRSELFRPSSATCELHRWAVQLARWRYLQG